MGGNTGMDPSATSFFQALNIPTKITKGTVEIITEMTLIRAGERVGSSEAALLAKLDIKPFSYGLLTVKSIDNGIVYEPKVLNFKNDDIKASIIITLENVAAMSSELHIPTLSAVPQAMIDGFKNTLA